MRAMVKTKKSTKKSTKTAAKKAIKIEEIIQSVYLNPLTDFGFKKIFEDKELMIAFINDIVGTEIKAVQYLPTEGLGLRAEDRKVIFDILCTTATGEFIIEMQLAQQAYFTDRALFYASHVVRKQAPRGRNWNYQLKPVYVVAILGFIAFEEETAKDEVIERVYLYREKAKTRFSDKLNLVFVELPKFNKKVKELKNNTEIWLFLLKNAFKLKSCPPEITGKIFKKFLEVAKVEQLTSEEMETYERSLRKSYIVRNVTSFAEKKGRNKCKI
jgi:predicted transposase/invertase (TIGR01784 family)